MTTRLVSVLASALLLAACATPPEGKDLEAPIAQECGRSDSVHLLPFTDPEDPPVAPGALAFPARSVETARLIGALPALRRWLELQDQRAELAVTLAARQQLIDRVHLASLEVASVLAEIDCEDERNDQLRDRLQSRDNRRLRQLTVAGIVVGASTAIGAGALGLAGHGNASNAVGLTGGIAEVGIGLAALREGEYATLTHPRNLLGDLWRGQMAQQTFPPAVWRYLNAQPDASRPYTVREQLIQQWQDEDWLGDRNTEGTARRIELFFGNGGRYAAADLQAREALLDTLQSRVAIFNQDIAALLRHLIQAAAQPR